MTFETFKNISRFFPYTENIHLSGWGEPLLNPYFLVMVEIAKRAGCSVGFTTNGALLHDAMIKKIIDLQTDLVSVSLAGVTAETHESKRVGSRLKQLTRNLHSIADLKRTFRTDKPHVLIQFMMTSENMHELPMSVELAAEVEADSVVATNLDYTPLPFHEELRAFSSGKADETFTRRVRETGELARNKNISFHAFPLEMKLVPVCSENPLNNFYVSEDGLVSPCVYLAPPIQEIPRIFCGENNVIPRTSFGNINEQRLFEIWSNSEYVFFRKKYEQRLRGILYRSVNYLPQVCKTCYKAYGV